MEREKEKRHYKLWCGLFTTMPSIGSTYNLITSPYWININL